VEREKMMSHEERLEVVKEILDYMGERLYDHDVKLATSMLSTVYFCMIRKIADDAGIPLQKYLEIHRALFEEFAKHE
jgi:hypothetical protein